MVGYILYLLSLEGGNRMPSSNSIPKQDFQLDRLDRDSIAMAIQASNELVPHADGDNVSLEAA